MCLKNNDDINLYRSPSRNGACSLFGNYICCICKKDFIYDERGTNTLLYKLQLLKNPSDMNSTACGVCGNYCTLVFCAACFEVIAGDEFVFNRGKK